jgi:hypothetical protein
MTERTSLSAVAAATWIAGTACHAAHTEPAEAFYMNRAVRFPIATAMDDDCDIWAHGRQMTRH